MWRLLLEAEKVNARPPAQGLRKRFHLCHLQRSSNSCDRQTVVIPVPDTGLFIENSIVAVASEQAAFIIVVQNPSSSYLWLCLAPANQQQRQEDEEGTWTLKLHTDYPIAPGNGCLA